jgi:GT2 family glycosyltransferase
MSGLAIVIVTYNSGKVIGSCLDACAGSQAEVVVVDNASGDETVELMRRRPSVKLIANQENRGFAAAVNQGIAATRAPLILLLNPDAILDAGIAELAETCRLPGTGAAAGQLIGSDGEFQRGFSVRRLPTAAALALEVLGINRLWPSNPINRRFRCLDFNPEKASVVEQPAGAFLMTPRKVWEEMAGFDENFFPLWFEDVDYLKRLKDRGLLVRYDPRARARHQGAHSLAGLDWEKRELYWYANLLRYAARHVSRPGRIAVCLAVAGGALLRLPVGIFRSRGLKPIRIYGKVLRLACRYLFFPGSGGWRSGTGTLINQAQIHVL